MTFLSSASPQRSSVVRAATVGIVAVGLLLALGSAAPIRAADGGVFVVLIGPPAAGKTTQGEFLSERYGVPLLNMTSVLEERVKEAGESTGSAGRDERNTTRYEQRRKALERLKQGELVDDEALNAIVAGRLSSEDCRNGFVLDGYPGSAEQAEFLDAFLESRGVQDLKVVFLDIPDEVALERMKEGSSPRAPTGTARDDYRHGFAEERLRQFREQSAPLLEFYEGSLLRVDGTQSIQAIQRELEAFLGG